MTGTWLESAGGGTTADLTALRPELGDLVARFDAQATTAIGERLRTLLGIRAAQMVGDEATLAAADAELLAQARQWPTHPDVSEAERAALDLCESFVMDVHAITDEQVVRVQQCFGDDGAIALLMNLALVDGFTKFRRVFAGGSR